MLPLAASREQIMASLFQSSPAPEGRCYAPRGINGPLVINEFQSSPAPEGRCYTYLPQTRTE